MTLVELLVVLGIIGMILAISVPGLARYSQQVRLKTTIRQVVGLLSLARSVAIGAHEDHAVVFDQETGELTVVNQATGEPLERVVRISKPVALEFEVGGQSSSEAEIVFRPTGGLKGRSVSLVLEDGGKRHVVTVTGTTGAVSVE